MVDVADKAETTRIALAISTVKVCKNELNFNLVLLG
jgi:molybdenum cofactor biosynthesis enzyme